MLGNFCAPLQHKCDQKAHGFGVNSLEEYEYNKVFAGRNWNHGETIELVLRGPSGSFIPTSFLLSVFCHELAHIKHMNHGPGFQALWKRLRAEVRALQEKGYYGDGYWSSGTRIIDSARVAGDGAEADEFPEFMCGGAHSKARPTRRRRHANQKREPIASNKTGRQTAKKRKVGARVKSKTAFLGEGSSLAEDPKGKGTGFGKQAGSKRAREERALAAERRLVQSQQASTSKSVPSETSESSEDEDELSDTEVVPETDAERRKQLLLSEPESSNTLNGISWRDFDNDFVFTRPKDDAKASSGEVVELSSDDDIPVASGSTFIMPPPAKTADSKKKASSSGITNMVQNEISLRKKEALGLAPVKAGSRVLGGSARQSQNDEPDWACKICTLINQGSFLACSACATPRA